MDAFGPRVAVDDPVVDACAQFGLTVAGERVHVSVLDEHADALLVVSGRPPGERAAHDGLVGRGASGGAEDPLDRLPVVRERLVGLVFDGLEDALHGFQDAVRALGQAGVEADAEQGEPLVDDQVVLFDGEPDA